MAKKETKLIFERYEKKYLLTPAQYESLFARLREYIEPDTYFKSTVCSVYYDNADYRLIRHSVERPVFKEKLRLRSYNVPEAGDTVFVEIKKKFKGVVYKRRAAMTHAEADAWLNRGVRPEKDSQIIREIQWFIDRNEPEAKALVCCEREAYVGREDSELRITFDRNIRMRADDLVLTHGSGGEELFDGGEVLMEIKFPETSPLWLAHMLCEEGVFPTSVSKYGTGYKKVLINDFLERIGE